jgi:hypothetical protein
LLQALEFSRYDLVSYSTLIITLMSIVTVPLLLAVL